MEMRQGREKEKGTQGHEQTHLLMQPSWALCLPILCIAGVFAKYSLALSRRRGTEETPTPRLEEGELHQDFLVWKQGRNRSCEKRKWPGLEEEEMHDR